MRSYAVRIEGVSPLLMHRFGAEAQAKVQAGTSSVTERDNVEVAAEAAAYRLPSENGKKGNLYIPAVAILRAIGGAASGEKVGRKSAAPFVAAGMFINTAAIDLGTSEYVIDSQPVVVPATRGRVIRHRPRLDKWAAAFTLDVDESLFANKEFVNRLLVLAGQRIGLLDFRPQKRGPYGRFIVTRFDEIT